MQIKVSARSANPTTFKRVVVMLAEKKGEISRLSMRVNRIDKIHPIVYYTRGYFTHEPRAMK